MGKPRGSVRKWSTLGAILLVATLAVPAAGVAAGGRALPTPDAQLLSAMSTLRAQHRLELGPPGFRTIPTRPLARPKNAPPAPRTPAPDAAPALASPVAPISKSAASTVFTVSAPSAPKPEGDPIDMKVLVLSADGNEVTLPAITGELDYLGIPYTVMRMAPVPSDPATDRLSAQLFSGIHAFYQGVILATGDLVYDSSGSFLSALTTTEWNALWSFEAAFGIRQVSWYTFPTPAYGFTGNASAVDTTTTPLTVPFTAAGTSVFGSYLKTSTPLRIADAYTYLDTPLDSATTPLLRDGAGHALAAIRAYPDGRQNLSLTFASNQYLLHNLLLQYGLVNWVTRGLFLGERHTYLAPQEDDIMIDDSIWQPTTPCGTVPDDPSLPTYRLTGTDLRNFTAWQSSVRSQSTTSNFRLNNAFNGVGTTAEFYADYRATHPGAPSKDTLKAQISTDRASYFWTSHTYNHENLDAISYADATTELRSNDQVAQSLRLPNYSKANLVQPDVSGLTNGEFMRAAKDFGVRYLISDTSRGGSSANPTPNTGVVSTLQPSILQIPRHPVNLYFNVMTPAQWLAEDNCLYPVGAFGHVNTYDQLLERESTVLLSYMARGDIDPLMFHQPNMATYASGKSLLGDLMTRTLSKYNQYFTLPVVTPSQDQIGAKMTSRAAYNDSGVTASIVPGLPGEEPESITLTAQRAATIPVTGLRTATSELYGGQYITYVTLAAGQSITFGPTVTLSPASVNFGVVLGSATKSVSLRNSGSFPLKITSIALSGSSDFTQTNNCPASLAAQASCTINVTFRPRGLLGIKSGMLTVTDNAPGSPHKVALSGTGLL